MLSRPFSDFPNPGEAGAAPKKQHRHHSTHLIIHDSAQCVKLKSKKNEKIPQFLEILTQRAVGCQIKLTIPLLMIHELSNFVKFFCQKNSAVSVFHRYRFGFCRDWEPRVNFHPTAAREPVPREPSATRNARGPDMNIF